MHWLKPSIVGNGILWVLGAAMQIGGWINQTVAIMLLVIAFLWSSASLTYWLKNRRKQTGLETGIKPIVDLKMGAKIEEIRTSGYYDKAEGGYPEGDKELAIRIAFQPSRSMTLDVLALQLWGERYEAKARPIRTLKKPDNYKVMFHIPRVAAINTENAQIYALAGNQEWYSEQFPINF